MPSTFSCIYAYFKCRCFTPPHAHIFKKHHYVSPVTYSDPSEVCISVVSLFHGPSPHILLSTTAIYSISGLFHILHPSLRYLSPSFAPTHIFLKDHCTAPVLYTTVPCHPLSPFEGISVPLTHSHPSKLTPLSAHGVLVQVKHYCFSHFTYSDPGLLDWQSGVQGISWWADNPQGPKLLWFVCFLRERPTLQSGIPNNAQVLLWS